MKSQNSTNKVFYGWIILSLSTVALTISNGLAITGIPVFFKWIREDFVASGAIEAGNAESFIAFSASLTFLVAGFISPLASWLIQKFSIRRLMILGCFILGSGLLLYSQTNTPLVVYLARTLMGASLGLIGVLANTVLVSNWFIRKRGLALGILLTGTSLGGVFIPQLANPLINKYGWRTAMVILSLLIWLILLPAIIFLVKNKPSDLGLLPDGDAVKPIEKNGNVEVKENQGLTLSEALKTPLFWVLAFCSALVFYPIFVTGQQFILYLQTPKIGLTSQEGAFALSALFAVSVGGKFLFGFLSDKISPTRVMLICCSVMFLATLILLNLSNSTAFIFLIPFGLGYGGTFVLIQRLVADYFGNRDYPKILSVITIMETLGAAIGGYFTGKLADANNGDYTQAFYVVIFVSAVALFLVILLNFMIRSNAELLDK